MDAQDLYTRNVSPITISTNKVLRNTYLLLSLTLLFSAITAYIALVENASNVNILLFLLVIFAFPWVLMRVKDSPLGLVLTFAYTGFMGWSIGPMLNYYLTSYSNGSQLIALSLGGTGLIFLCLTLISLNPNRDYTGWARPLFVGMMMVIVLSLLNVFFLKMPVLQLALAVVIMLISGGLILYQTNMIIRGGERNYIVATVVLYISIINLFLSLLQLLGFFGGNRN